MNEFLALMIPILVIDVANPVLLATVVVALTADRPIALSLAVICGHTLAYFTVGVLVLFGLADLLVRYLQPVVDWFNSPTTWDFVISFFLGLLLIVVAWRWKAAPPKPSENEPEQVEAGVIIAFGFGAILNFIGIPFAIPYFAFIGNLFRLDDETLRMGYLVVYNILYAAPFLLLAISVAVIGRSLLPFLERINAVVEKYSGYVMPLLIGLVGLGLVTDATKYFLTGNGLL